MIICFFFVVSYDMNKIKAFIEAMNWKQNKDIFPTSIISYTASQHAWWKIHIKNRQDSGHKHLIFPSSLEAFIN